MPGEPSLSIGDFARVTGLTAKALRHYDAVGLLPPAGVADNGYRRYTHDQVPIGRLVRRLRGLELPLDEVKRLVGLAGDADAMGTALEAHRQRLDARLTRLQRQLHELHHFIEDKEWMVMPNADPTTAVDAATQRKLAITLFNRVWQLLEIENRTEAQDAEMIHAAHASTYHWMQVGEPVNRARGEWQCSRVYAVLKRAEPALFHARNVLMVCEQEKIGDWDLAFAYEALARAHSVAGEADESRRWLELAHAACAQIVDDADREVVLSDLETVPSS
jgi:DNA-binding transcriptional MerR regulator